MTIITAVELRKNMGEIFRRVAAGEDVAVTYRDSKPIRLTAQKPEKTTSKTSRGLLDSLVAASRDATCDPIGDRDLMEAYYSDTAAKYDIS